MSETNRIEYKRELNADMSIEKEVVAFLNYHPGGMTDKGCFIRVGTAAEPMSQAMIHRLFATPY